MYVLKEFGGESSARDERDWGLARLAGLAGNARLGVYLVRETGEASGTGETRGLVWFVWLGFRSGQRDKPDERNKRDKTERPDQPDGLE